MRHLWTVGLIAIALVALVPFAQTRAGILIWFVGLPSAAAMAAIAASVWALRVRPTVAQAVVAVPVVVVAASGVYGLIAMVVASAWPTFLPHVALAIVCPVAGLQLRLARRARRTVRIERPGSFPMSPGDR